MKQISYTETVICRLVYLLSLLSYLILNPGFNQYVGIALFALSGYYYFNVLESKKKVWYLIPLSIFGLLGASIQGSWNDVPLYVFGLVLAYIDIKWACYCCE